MNRLEYFVAAAVAVVCITAPPASAQTPVNITVLSGNGQLICPNCTTTGSGGLAFFDAMYVKVTDANGNPVSGATVSWNITSSVNYGSFGNQTQTDQTSTDSNGIAFDRFYYNNPPGGGGSVTDPWHQAVIVASIPAGSVTFYQTLTFPNLNNNNGQSALVGIQLDTPATNPPCPNCNKQPGDLLTGSVGTTSTTIFQITAYSIGTVLPQVPNVSFRLVPNQSTPSISCATGAGADPGSVLTDASGTAVCSVILGSSAGFGSFYALGGGVASVGYNQGGSAAGYFQSGNFSLNVTPGTASILSVVSGNGQSATPGQAVALPLIAQVGDAANNPLSGQQVTWTVSPSAAATLSNSSSTSDANGRVQTRVTLTNNAAGQIQVKAALTSNPNVSATFIVTANVQVTGLTIISGNNQTALVNATFASPLVVQLTAANGAPASGIPVNFGISGPAFLSASSVNTDSNGRASISVTAAGSTGPVSVTASSGSFSTTFSLSVIPQGPSLTTGSFYNGADFQQGSISPCSVATIIAPGVAAAIQGTVAYNGIGALPYLLAGDQVTFGGAQAPIYNVSNANGQQQITVQVPCSVTPGTVSVVVNVGGGSASVNVPVLPASPGLFLTQFASAPQIPVLERPDGSFVSATNPAHRGETLIAYVTGLGATSPSVTTNALPAPGSSPSVLGTIIVGMNGQGVPLNSASVSTDLVGVETVSFVVPSSTSSGNSTFSIGVLPQGSSTVYYSQVGVFPIQ